MNVTCKAFVIGHPIRQSRSPMIHNYWLKLHGLAGSYEAIDVEPAAFEVFIESLREGAFVGGNVTMPHKEAACAAADILTDRAERLQAVNTLWMEAGKLHGDNTDIVGFTANLDQTLGVGWHQNVKRALIIGAGGAARAVLAGLLTYPGLHITIVNRTPEKAWPLIAFDRDRVSVSPWQDLDREAERAGLVVNTTSLGMDGYPPLDIDFSGCDPATIVTDIVYIPLMTPLLATARRQSLRVVDGLGMLLHQAVPGFARWFGVTPEVTPQLRRLILDDMGEP